MKKNIDFDAKIASVASVACRYASGSCVLGVDMKITSIFVGNKRLLIENFFNRPEIFYEWKQKKK